ncbi:MAG: DUF1385 domain-containing protein [Bacteroidetes bacterium]|nr:DUF1385 domain-containing protein [Bacteroidota bacterium]MCW5895344.1 DUF1385 domain-containing protein [Bacteroidota bacterium]
MAVGGQAVLEGVMMRAPGMVATAVRRAGGDITVKKESQMPLSDKYPLLKLPVLRGAVGLVEMMVIGIRTLNFSAEVAMEDADKENNANGNANLKKPHSPSKENLKLGLTVAFSLALGVAVFFVTPLAVTTFLFDVEQDPFWFNLIAGGVRISLLLAYLGVISMLRDIKRLFQYHGAEHKAVFAFEKGEELSVEAAAKQSRFHPRCGTSFLLIVMCTAIVLFSVLDVFLMRWLGELNVLIRIATHLPLIPVVGGISYEFIRWSAKRSETPFGKVIVAPGLWLQKITTQEPDESQLEVAVIALRCALGEDYESVSPQFVDGIRVN